MHRNRTEDWVHSSPSFYEDLMIVGGSCWFCECSCGWKSRPCTTQGIAHGLWRRHLVTKGRR